MCGRGRRYWNIILYHSLLLLLTYLAKNWYHFKWFQPEKYLNTVLHYTNQPMGQQLLLLSACGIKYSGVKYSFTIIVNDIKYKKKKHSYTMDNSNIVFTDETVFQEVYGKIASWLWTLHAVQRAASTAVHLDVSMKRLKILQALLETFFVKLSSDSESSSLLDVIVFLSYWTVKKWVVEVCYCIDERVLFRYWFWISGTPCLWHSDRPKLE